MTKEQQYVALVASCARVGVRPACIPHEAPNCTTCLLTGRIENERQRMIARTRRQHQRAALRHALGQVLGTGARWVGTAVFAVVVAILIACAAVLVAAYFVIALAVVVVFAACAVPFAIAHRITHPKGKP